MKLYYIDKRQFEYTEDRRGKCPYIIKEAEVNRETSRSYVLDYDVKVSKKELQSIDRYNGLITQYYLTYEDAQKAMWLEINKFNIIQYLRSSKNYDLYKHILSELQKDGMEICEL